MDKVLVGVILGLITFILVSAGGTIFYFIYPVFAPAFGLPELGWLQSVCLVWATHILTHNTTKISTNKD